MGQTFLKATILPCQVSSPIALAIFYWRESDVGKQIDVLNGEVGYILIAISLSALTTLLQVVTYLLVLQSNLV
jgi:hypothetical protein